MTYSESEPDFPNFAINSLLTFCPIFAESKSESDDSELDILLYVQLRKNSHALKNIRCQRIF